MMRRSTPTTPPAAPLRPEARAPPSLEALDAGLGNSVEHPRRGRGRARPPSRAARGDRSRARRAPARRSCFTSGATEANNSGARRLAPRLAAGANDPHLAVLATEHASVLAAGARARRDAVSRVTELPRRRRRAPPIRPTSRRASRSALGRARRTPRPASCRTCVRSRARGARRGGSRPRRRRPGAAALTAARRRRARRRTSLTLSSSKLGGPGRRRRALRPGGTPLAPLHRGGPQEQGSARRHRERRRDRRLRDRARHSPVAEREARGGAPRRRYRTRSAAGIAAAWPGARFMLSAERPRTAPHVSSLVLPGVRRRGRRRGARPRRRGRVDRLGVRGRRRRALARAARDGTDAADARGSLRVSLGWASTRPPTSTIILQRARACPGARIARRSEEAAWPAHGS